MRTLVRVSLCALAGAGLIVAVAWGFACWQVSVAGDLDLAGAGRWLMAEVHKDAELTTRNEVMSRKVAGEQEAIDELFQGGLTLQEAGDEFRRLDDEARQAEDPADSTTEAATPAANEALYRKVLTWAGCTAPHEANGAARYAQLQAEMDDLLHRALHRA